MAKVLVLDDDRSAQALLVKIFEKAGHETVAAGTVQAAWSKLNEQVLIDLVVLDNHLGHEWGWQFLRMVRQSPVFRELPVIVYTAHTERSSIVRYVELGVQRLHVKPYQADVLALELQKAVATGWTSKVMEPTESVLLRARLSLDDYGAVLATAVRTIDENLQLARRRLAIPHDKLLRGALTNIEQQCRGVGIAVIDQVMRQVEECLGGNDLTGAVDGLRVIESFLGMIRHRMLAVMKVGDAAAVVPLSVDSPPAAGPVEAEVDVKVGSEVMRDMLHRPFWHFGPRLRRLIRSPLLDEKATRALWETAPGVEPFATMIDCMKGMVNGASLSVGELVQRAQSTPGLVATYAAVVEPVTGVAQPTESTAALSRVMAQQGVAKGLALLAVARISAVLPQRGLLNLRPLHRTGLGVSLLALETGRLLKLSHDYVLPAAGLAHNAGAWLLAVREPEAFAIALAATADGETSGRDAQRAVFGLDEQEAGRQFLAAAEMPEILQSVAAWHTQPSQVPVKEHVITVTVVHLAGLLMQAAGAGSNAQAAEILEKLKSPDYVAWRLLREHGVEVPFGAPEMVATLAEIAATCNWTLHQFLDRHA